MLFDEIINDCHDKCVAMFSLPKGAPKVTANLDPDLVGHVDWVKHGCVFEGLHIKLPGICPRI